MKKHKARQFELGWRNEPFRLCGEPLAAEEPGAQTAQTGPGLFPALALPGQVMVNRGKGGAKTNNGK